MRRNNDVLMDTESVPQTIMKTIASSDPHPSPLPDGESGLSAVETTA